MTRRAVPLRWRVALWVAAASAVLAVVALVTALWVVRSALRADLQQALQDDAQRIAELYGEGEGDVALAGPTGRVVLQLYDPNGRLLAASDPAFETPEATLPPEALEAPDRWRGRVDERRVQVASEPFALGVVAVLADTEYIGRSVRDVARALSVAGILLVVAALPFGLLVATAATLPLRRLADTADRLGPERLEPIPIPPQHDEVGRLARSLDELVARLRAARDEQRTFLAETSHELRTPLTSLRGFLDRAQRNVEGRARRDVEDAGRIAATMARLVEDLLELSRGRLVRDVELHLVDLVHDVARPVAHEFGVEPEADAEAALVVGDPERLQQAVRNLVANAVRACEGDASRVLVRVATVGRQVCILVHDDGPGIPEGLRERLFQTFAKGPGGGSGLGLAIARQIAERHGGRLTVDGDAEGTLFTLSLPALEEAAEGDV